MLRKIFIPIFILIQFSSFAQIDSTTSSLPKPIDQMTREDVMQMESDDFMELPLDVLMKLSEKLGISLQELQEMMLNKKIVSASKSEENSFDSPLSSSVLLADDIHKSGVTSLVELLRLIPGVIVRQKTNGNYDVHIRGNDYVPPGEMSVFTENYITLVMIDNRPVYSYFQGGTFWETLPVSLMDIEKIEVIRGPSAALYGPNAVSGVIHIITRKPLKKEPTFDANVQAGNFNTLFANTSFSFGIKKSLKFRISANYQHSNRFDDMYLNTLDGRFVTGDKMKQLYDSTHYDVNKSEALSDYNHSNRQMGANFYGFWDWKKNIKLSLTAGVQQSEIQTVYIDMFSWLSTRSSFTSYSIIKLNLWGVNIQTSARNGVLNTAQGYPGFKYDIGEFSTVVDKEFKIGKFKIRPGFSIEQAIYADTQYVDESIKQGFLNKADTVASFAFYLRSDYQISDKIRLIAAVSQGFYYKPQSTFTSFQLCASYKANENNMFRIVHSRANSSTFMAVVNADYHSVFPQSIFGSYPGKYYASYQLLGSKDPELLTMDMTELGIRNRVSDCVSVDIEIFASTAKNFTSQVLDSVKSEFFLQGNRLTQDSLAKILSMGVLPDSAMITQYNMFKTSPVKSLQTGITSTIDVVLNEKLSFKLFGTLQITQLRNYIVNDSTVLAYLTGAHIPQNQLYNSPLSLRLENKYTPSLYGGIVMNYAAGEKWNFNISGYGFSKQQMMYAQRTFLTPEVKPWFSASVKVLYKFWSENYVYLTARNLSWKSSNEFMYGDYLKPLVLAGINLSF